MSVVAPAAPYILRTGRGRVRIHIPDWIGLGERNLARHLREMRGIETARASELTGNVMIGFDARLIDDTTILGAVRELTKTLRGEGYPEPSAPPALSERQGDVRRARIAVRGLDRHPRLAQHVVERLGQLPGVQRVVASPLTGRVLVEFGEQIDLEDILSAVTGIELPALPGEDRPRHPLDRGPLLQSILRAAGSALGLTILALRRLASNGEPPSVQAAAVRTSIAISILQGFPIVRYGLRRLVGRDAADVLFHVPGILSLTAANNPLGLLVNGAEAVRLLTEVVARRSAWRRYEERVENAGPAEPGAILRLETGDRVPRGATVLEGTGTASGPDGLPVPLRAGSSVAAGARLFGGPFTLELQAGRSFMPAIRPGRENPTIESRYLRALTPLSLGYAVLTGILTRSIGRAFSALLIVNPRTAMIGIDAADAGAAARVVRAGVTVVGTRSSRAIRAPDVLVIDGPRSLADGFEVSSAYPLDAAHDAEAILSLARSIAAAAGSPWGGALAGADITIAREAHFDGDQAQAQIDDKHYTLRPLDDCKTLPPSIRLQYRGDRALVLWRDAETPPLGIVGLRPRLRHGISDLIDTCRRHGVEMVVLEAGDSIAAQALARRAGISQLSDSDPELAIRQRQEGGAIVACVSDSADAAPALAAADLAIALSTGRSGRFQARVDLLAPDLVAVAAIVEAGARRRTVIRDSVILAGVANGLAGVAGVRGQGGLRRALQAVYAASLGALLDSWLRLRRGERPISSIARLVDPRPERWGGQSIEQVLRLTRATRDGLTVDEAAERRHVELPPIERNRLAGALLDQLRSPLTGILAGAAALSVILGSTADVVVISATLLANAVVGTWQEFQAGQAVAALQRIGSSTVKVLRDGQVVTVPVQDVVPGDILVLAPGERIGADARLISASSLEVDEAALTGESLPMPKAPGAPTDAARVVLAGSDVTVGTGRAVVVAVGSRTRLGATAAALALDETRASPLGIRLNRLLRQVLPLAGAGGLVVLVSGLLHGTSPLSQLAIAGSIAVAAVPEGLPLLAGTAEAAVARRLSARGALVRRLSAVEALGRVDVACTDKTGTLTEGRPALRVVANLDKEITLPGTAPQELQEVLLTAALATPHPEAADAMAHPTDVVVREGARAAGLGAHLGAERHHESAFEPTHPFHSAIVLGKLRVKGAAEALIGRCDRVWREGRAQPLEEAGRQKLIERAEALSSRGLRLLTVAEGPPDASPEDPHGLIALGFIGIADPLRPDVPDAIRRTHEAGIRVIMLTGDHPATARAIAREAGLLRQGGEIITGDDIDELDGDELDRRLERAVVVARVTPLDKLRIVQSLQRSGHTVAMTGDGVNDAPALRLADVGVAMGRGGTEVARQAAAVVLADDNFSTLVEALVEGRSFWRNIRRALGLLLGGNLGELGLMVGGSVLGVASPLISRQILAVNLVTDVLPSLAVALQPPESRHLASLAREGTAALDRPLREDMLRRGALTAGPSLAAYLLSLRASGLDQARSVAFASVVATQLAQTLDAGWAEGTLTRSVLGAVGGSAAVLAAALTFSPLRGFLGLVTPTPFGWLLIGSGALLAMALGRLHPAGRLSRVAALPMPRLRQLPARV